MTGKLLLLPNLLDESLPYETFLPASVKAAVASLQGLIAESEKAGRRYARRFLSHEEMARLPLKTLNEHTPEAELNSLILPMEKGEVWGLISDAGLPCIADPGAPLVATANQKKIPVETFAGPCSLVFALQLSGFFGQNFSFHGYLPREIPDLEQTLGDLEKRSRSGTQIWIEAPYRSSKMLEILKRILHPATRLCVAVNLTMPNQRVLSQTAEKWKSDPFSLQKEPAVFLLDSHS